MHWYGKDRYYYETHRETYRALKQLLPKLHTNAKFLQTQGYSN